MVKWNKADTQSEYLKHQLDSLDYWSIWLAKQRMRVQENLLDYSYKFQDITNKKIPPNLFDTNKFYSDLQDTNLRSDQNYSK